MAARDPMIGRLVLGRYRIVRALAKGGMGVVYLARGEGASGFTKPYVVKRMASDILVDDNMLKMFVREARLMARLRHPGLVMVTDFGEEGGDYLMVLEYIHGFHLGQWNRFIKHTRGLPPTGIVLHTLTKVLDALHYAHTLKDSNGRPLQVVHRDVSPSNILLDVEGHVKLADFGVARSQEHTEKTEETTIKGKMPYLAPELFRLAAPSASTDVYAVAVVMHELLVGRNEFRGGDMATTVSRVLEHTPTPVDAVRDDLPDGLGDLVQKALDKNPTVRFTEAADFAAALREVRKETEEEAQATLAALVQQDFLDPQIATLLRIPSLAERDEAWRNPPPEILQTPAPRVSSSPPTVVERPSKKRAPRVLFVVLGLVVVGAIGGTAAWALVNANTSEARQTTFVVVDRIDASASQETPDTTADAEAEATPDAEVDANVARPTSGADRDRNYPAAFTRRSSEVVACFNQHGNEGANTVRVSFNVESSGRVASAALSPSRLMSTALGRCILGIAGSTRFPPRREPVRFSIPLNVSGAR
ncbi:MAG: protein kinase [Myxococcota bacterium]